MFCTAWPAAPFTRLSITDSTTTMSEPAVRCSGFQYGFTFDEVQNEDDAVMEKNGVTLLIDPMSYQYLTGAEIDYQEGLEGAQFVIKNPNAQSTCGCGSSFST